MLDLADKDFKVASLNMFLKTKKKLKEKGMLTVSHQKIENIYKGVELVLKRNKMEILELESLITKMKNLPNVLHS